MCGNLSWRAQIPAIEARSASEELGPVSSLALFDVALFFRVRTSFFPRNFNIGYPKG